MPMTMGLWRRDATATNRTRRLASIDPATALSDGLPLVAMCEATPVENGGPTWEVAGTPAWPAWRVGLAAMVGLYAACGSSPGWAVAAEALSGCVGCTAAAGAAPESSIAVFHCFASAAWLAWLVSGRTGCGAAAVAGLGVAGCALDADVAGTAGPGPETDAAGAAAGWVAATAATGSMG